MENFLQRKIEALREQMIEAFIEHGCLTHEHVISISQKLDKYIVEYEHLKVANSYVKAASAL